MKEIEGTKSLDDLALGETLLADIRAIFDAEFAEETKPILAVRRARISCCRAI